MHVLVVEDDLPTMKLISFLLKDAGYQVSNVYDGANLLPFLEQHRPDLVLLDVELPKANGFDLCRAIRNVSNVPIIFLTGRADLADRVQGLHIGADDYLTKPFEPAELLARVNAVLRRRDADLLAMSTRLSIGSLTLDPLMYTVILGEGRFVALTPIEFRLLHYLVRNPGRIMTSGHILSNVWGYKHGDDSNLVAVYMRRLRNKIETDPDRPQYIITIRHLGYRFEIPSRSRAVGENS